MFRSVLIANRGEIALRVARSSRELGIETVMVFSEADRDAPWLEAADRSVCIGPARADRSYLDADSILQAAEQQDCQAIHPGYGFLSENAMFAARCEQQGITFVGPRSETIRLMGDKASAKRAMRAAGLPTIPGSEGIVASAAEAREMASVIGYPVLLKASAGGGGKGMRLCRDRRELESGFQEAALEADKAFGDSALYLEKFIEGGRHVEFQVLCDAHRAGVHLGERDCSVQRKHQKLIEESPSPVVDSATRDELGRAVVRAVVEAGYRGAGTVEFLRDGEGRFYFMEMNTRLQVEHPVTEMVTGLDLVAEQFKIAANRPLDFDQDDVRLEGHALELRINAEDPLRGFQPDPGTIGAYGPPPAELDGARIRWDSAIREGYRIPPYYDSMVGKLIVHGPDRPAALRGAAAALDRLRLEGVRTTIDLHRRVLATAEFREGRYDVGFLGRSGLLDGGS